MTAVGYCKDKLNYSLSQTYGPLRYHLYQCFTISCLEHHQCFSFLNIHELPLQRKSASSYLAFHKGLHVKVDYGWSSLETTYMLQFHRNSTNNLVLFSECICIPKGWASAVLVALKAFDKLTPKLENSFCIENTNRLHTNCAPFYFAR